MRKVVNLGIQVGYLPDVLKIIQFGLDKVVKAKVAYDIDDDAWDFLQDWVDEMNDYLEEK